MKFKFVTLFTILSLIFFTACDSKDEASQEPTLPKFTLKTHDGKDIKLEAINEGIIFKGYEKKAILLNFFATWCPPCKAEIPHLNNLKKRYDGKLEIISVLLEENKTKEDLEAFIKEYNINFLITNSDENFTLSQSLGGIKSIPTMLLFGQNGDIVEKYVGMVPEEMLAFDIEKAIQSNK